jgi:hypothetical protein
LLIEVYLIELTLCPTELPLYDAFGAVLSHLEKECRTNTAFKCWRTINYSISPVNNPLISPSPQAGGSKRKGSTDPSLPGRKKPRKKPRGLDEDTMVAMALSHSLLEQEKEMEREMQRDLQREREGGQQLPAVLPHISLSPLKWRAEPSKTSKSLS